jgi:tRNA/rRNA methyltransferase
VYNLPVGYRIIFRDCSVIMKKVKDQSKRLNRISNIKVVLSRPLYAGNIGAVCRAMANMGLSELVIVGSVPKQSPEARKMACQAVNILESAVQVAELSEAVSDCVAVFGTTSRSGLYRQHAKTPKEWSKTILDFASQGQVALLFGPEDNGLDNSEIALCSHLIHIPSSPQYHSLNISQAVMVCVYELYLAADLFPALYEKSPLATVEDKERMFALWNRALQDIGFMEEDKASHMMFGLRRILSRGHLTDNDVRILMGIARQTQWCAGQLKHNNNQD